MLLHGKISSLLRMGFSSSPISSLSSDVLRARRIHLSLGMLHIYTISCAR